VRADILVGRGVLQADVRNSKKHAGRSFNVSHLASRPACRYIILLTICSKAVKAMGIPRNDAEARQRKRQLLIPGGYTLLRWKFFTDDLSLLRTPPFPAKIVSRQLGHFAIRNERRPWISRGSRPKIHAFFYKVTIITRANVYVILRYTRLKITNDMQMALRI